MNEQTLRVGIIGAGANTRKMHIPGLQAIAGVEVVSVCNRSRASGEQVAREFGIPRVCETWREVVDDPGVDAVVIGTWPYMHRTLTCAGLEAGKHVLCEARMAMNAAEAHAMLDTARARPDLVAQIVPSPFTLAFDATIQTKIGEGWLGDPLAIDVRHVTGTFPDREAPLTWRQDAGLSGLNVMTMGIWYEALARWVGHAGSVFATTRTVVRQRPVAGATGLAAVGVPDHVDILARMECGAQARMQFSAVLGLAAPTTEIWLYGSEGTLRLDGAGETLWGGRRGDAALEAIPVPEDARERWRVEEEFVGAIRGQEPVRLTTLEEGVRYMEFTEAVTRSAASGAVVHLPL